MSEYVTHTFQQGDDTEFATEFADCVTKRDAWLSELQKQIDQQPSENGLKIPGIGRALVYREGTDLAKVARYEARLQENWKRIQEAIDAGNDTAAEYRMQQHGKMIAAAEDANATDAEKMLWKNTLASDAASNNFSLNIFLTPDSTKSSSQKDFSKAYLDYLTSKKALLAAIESDIGNDYQLTKWISESLTSWKDDDANDIILKLLKPTFITKDASVDSDTVAATLQSTINPAHVNAKVDFQWGTTNTYGQFQPTTQSNQGKGVDDIAFSSNLGTGLNPSTTYHFAVRLQSKYLGYFYGDDKTFTTNAGPPPDPETWSLQQTCNDATLVTLYSTSGTSLIVGTQMFTDFALTASASSINFSDTGFYYGTDSDGYIITKVACVVTILNWNLHDSNSVVYESGNITLNDSFTVSTPYSPTIVGKILGLYPQNITDIELAFVNINGVSIDRAAYNDNVNWDAGNWNFTIASNSLFPFVTGDNSVIITLFSGDTFSLYFTLLP